MFERALMKLEARDDLQAQERQALCGALNAPRRFSAGEELVREGSKPRESTVLLDGWAARITTLERGAQQISELHVPGDFVDLHSFLLHRMDHSVVALSDGMMVGLPHSELRRMTERFPHLTRMLWMSTLIDAAIHRQWVVGLGRRSAMGQLAHLLCEMCVRLSVVGLARENGFEFHLNQGQLSDALGRSRGHVNVSIQELRTRRLVAWEPPRIRILDWKELARLGEFEDSYLQLGREPA
jgi:CRP-like cAMP-binding protein